MGGSIREKAHIVLILAFTLVIGIGLSLYWASPEDRVSVFHAGSLSRPFEIINNENDDFNLKLEPSGSVEALRKITTLGKTPDIIAVSDYTLIQDHLIPDYTDWYVQFARNEVVIAYNQGGIHSDEINENNWFEILSRPDVKFALGDPNADPGGYRIMMTLMLADIYYSSENIRIFDELITSNTNIETPENDNGIYNLEVLPLSDLRLNRDKIRVESMEIAAVLALKEGSVDYMFNYRSVAEQFNFEYLELPDKINLSDVEHEDYYAQTQVKLSDGKIVYGKPIVYAVTALDNARNMDASMKFLRYLLSDEGLEVFDYMGQPSINPSIVNNLDYTPDYIMDLVIEHAD